MKKILLAIVLLCCSTTVTLAEECAMENQTSEYLEKLFTESEYLYSLLWWESKDSKQINAYSFVINGVDTVPIFPTEEDAKFQVAGSGYEKNIVAVKPGLLAGILQGMEHAIVNPGSNNPVLFKTCAVKKFIEPIK